MMVQSLSGPALLWYSNYVTDHPSVLTYDCASMIQLLDDRFIDKMAVSNYNLEYGSLVKRDMNLLGI